MSSPNSNLVLVQVDFRNGDEIVEVYLRKLDRRTLVELQSFIETGDCAFDILGALAALRPLVAPGAHPDHAFANRDVRESVCAAFVCDAGERCNVQARFSRQLK
jgi:hypothetical protein